MMRVPYRWRNDPRYYLAAVACWHHGHREERTGTHMWCSRCGSAWGWDQLPPGFRASLPPAPAWLVQLAGAPFVWLLRGISRQMRRRRP